MKAKNLFFGALTCLAFAACSNDDEPVVNPGGEAEASDRYVVVNIVAPNNATRAAGEQTTDTENPTKTFEDGTETENTITDGIFIFFDGSGNSTQVEKPTLTMTGTVPTTSPYVEKVSQAVLVLDQPNPNPASVLAVINTGLDVSDFTGKKLSDIQAMLKDYSASASGKFVMSNSVFDGQVATPIRPDQILQYGSGENKDNVTLDPEKAVDIYVERVLARVDVDAKDYSIWTNKSAASASAEDANIISYKVPTIDALTGITTWTTKTIQVTPEVQGLQLSYTTPISYLVKKLPSDIESQWGLSGAGQPIWNDPTNMRSYWAESATSSSAGWTKFGLYNYSATTAPSASAEVSFYCQENTNSYSTADAQATKLVITAQHKIATAKTYDAEGKVTAWNDASAKSLVKYMTEYYLAEDFDLIMNAAIQKYYYEVSTGVYSNDWTDYLTLARKNSKTETSNKKAYIVMPDVIATSLPTAVYTKNSEDNYVAETIDPSSSVEKFLEEKIAETITTDIWCWQNGKAYYYVDIEHINHVTTTNPRYAIIRNHIYNLDLNTIKGLGTPIFWPNTDNDTNGDDPTDPTDPEDPDDDEPIDPEKPSDETFYVSCQLNVLKWRVVKTQNVEIGW